MDELRLSGDEEICVRVLARLLRAPDCNPAFVYPQTLEAALKAHGWSPSADGLPGLLRAMEGYGLIHSKARNYGAFAIEPRVEQIVRLLDERQKPDLVHEAGRKLRENPWTAYPMIVLYVVIFFGTLALALKAIFFR